MLYSKSYSISNIRKYIVGINIKVPTTDGRKVKYINFDNAASTPPLVPVLNRVNKFLEWYSNIHRGTGYKSKISTNAYEEAREIVVDFVNADLDKNTVIFVKNTTEAINKLSYRLNLSKDDVVITTLMEHHSNDLPWRNKAKTIYVNLLNDGRLDLNDLEKKLKKYKERVKLITLTGASNVTGYVNEIHTVASLSHKYNAKILVDCAQLAPHRKINMKGYKDDDYLDFIAFSAHKMYAPFGTGVLIGPKSMFNNGDPEYVGGGTILSVTRYNNFWTAPPEKEEAGTPNVIGAIALAEAINVLKEINMKKIEEHERKITQHLISRLRTIPDVRIFSIPRNNSFDDMVGVVSFEVKDIPHNLIASILSYEGGIGVRSGCFCAHPYIHSLLKLSTNEISKLQQDLVLGKISNTPGLVRVSFGMYNTIDEIDRFIEIFKNTLENKKDILNKYIFDRKSEEYRPLMLDKNMFNDFPLKQPC